MSKPLTSQVPNYGKMFDTVIDDKRLTIGARFIYAVLDSYAGANGVFPSVRLLSERVGASKSTVKRWLRELNEAGWIESRRRKDKTGRRTTNEYILFAVNENADYGDLEGDGFTSDPGDRFTGEPGDGSTSDPIVPLNKKDLEPNDNEQDTAAMRQQELSSANVELEPESKTVVVKAEDVEVLTPDKSQRNQLFEAVAEAWTGHPPGSYVSGMVPPRQASAITDVVNELLEVNAQPDEVHQQWAIVVQRFPNPSPYALVKWWKTAGSPIDAQKPLAVTGSVAKALAEREKRKKRGLDAKADVLRIDESNISSLPGPGQAPITDPASRAGS